MDNKFISCPKCGTRNFADDKTCGICKAKLNSADNSKPTQITSKPNYFILVLIFVGIIFIYYNAFHKDKPIASHELEPTSAIYQTSNSQASLPKYTILETVLNNKRAFNIVVRINEKLLDTDLKLLAQKIKKDINAISEKGVVFFLLPEMKADNGAWAAVDFNPEIKIRILGQSVNDEQRIKSGLENITDYFGLWQDNKSEGEIIIRIRKDKKLGYVFEYISPTNPKPSELAKPLIKSIKNGKIIFKDTEHPEQYFLLENNGDLSVYDNEGYFETYKRLK